MVSNILYFSPNGRRRDVSAFIDVCAQLGVPACAEISRSGNGAHVWVFFVQAVPAVQARRLGTALLTQTTARRHEVGLDSYDRLFPGQDTLSGADSATSSALPLQRQPRDCGRSVFVDADFQPASDQWRMLSCVERMTLADIEGALARALEGRQCPRRAHCPVRRCRGAVATAGLRTTAGVPHQGALSCCDRRAYIALPRGCFDDVIELLQHHGIAPRLQDDRFTQRKRRQPPLLASWSPPAVASARDSMMHDWTRCSWPCRWPGGGPFNSTPGGCTACTRASQMWSSTTTLRMACRCWHECIRSGLQDIARWAARSKTSLNTSSS